MPKLCTRSAAFLDEAPSFAACMSPGPQPVTMSQPIIASSAAIDPLPLLFGGERTAREVTR
jgi:hypothetical protein